MFSVCASVEHLLQIGVQEHPCGVQLSRMAQNPLEGRVHFLKVLPGAVEPQEATGDDSRPCFPELYFMANLCLCACMCDPLSSGMHRTHAGRYMHAHTHNPHACAHTHVCMYAHVYMHIGSCTNSRVMCVHICTHTHACMHIHM